MSTYYTPKATEFCLGFIFEAKKDSGLIPDVLYEEGQEWKQTEWGLFDFINPRYNPEYFRVKHLDREDIEGEGWDFDGDTEERYVLGDNNYIMFRFGETSIYAIKKSNSFEKHNIKFCGYDTMFEGTILNLSEFRKLMKQLNIKKP